ncbi:hypothetical protein FOMPIDRAFT_1023931 [Fomitopsis schrenkii]|uniref:Uncharacterized protein n=1 Tax=Fomitopsis schrenkii TaxID=2126942 RepID=S8E4Y6_FOMSC|nr:hypothetical protein FOMPIDRAFT_1023931 [Fomitopsis schrenkii]
MVSSSSSARRKRKAKDSSPEPADPSELIEQLIARAKTAKPLPKRLKLSTSPTAKVSFDDARQETNAGFKGKGKEVIRPKTKGSKGREGLQVGRIVLLPFGFNRDDSSVELPKKHNLKNCDWLTKHGLSTTTAPDGGEIWIKPGMDWAEVDKLVRKSFPFYFIWLEDQGVDTSSSYHWKIVKQSGRELHVAYFKEGVPMPYADLCVSIHKATSRWQERVLCFVTTRVVPTWRSWGDSESCRPKLAPRPSLRDIEPDSVVFSEGETDALDDVGLGAAHLSDENSGTSGNETDSSAGSDTDISEYPVAKSSRVADNVGLGGTRKLSRNVALGFEGSLASIHLSGDEQAFASASASEEPIATNLGSSVNPIALDLPGESGEAASPSSTSADLATGPPFTQASTSSQPGPSRITRSQVPPEVVMQRGPGVAPNPWRF